MAEKANYLTNNSDQGMLAAHSLLSIVTFGAGAAEWTNLSYLGIQVAKRRKREARRQTDSPELLTFTSRLESS